MKCKKNRAGGRVALEEFSKGDQPVREICKLYGISRGSLYRVTWKEGVKR
ncbi:helix-turn-helix domain-containing protein [Kroppenstedtia pulmonis]|uniref:Helix-turn-helix domain-containing protein n=1 Tax=Kroppenstedtia pulmonis TaxID=1380685 RepID=A0A7D4BRT5_9BACL|nr:helix-turn-helix domain-containing protein [Kroppenstedtia pulmonis]